MDLGRRIIRQRRSLRNLIYRLMDAGAILAGLILAISIYPQANSDATLISCLAAIGLFSLACEFTAMYRDWQGVSLARELTCALTSWALTLICLVIFGQFSNYTTELTGGPLAVWFATTPALSVMGRYALRLSQKFLVDHGMLGKGFAVVGINSLGIQLVRNINDAPELGLKFMGFYDDRPESRTEPLPDDLNRRLGCVDQLVGHAKSGKISKIFIVLPMRAERRIDDVLTKLSDTTASVYMVPDFFVFKLLHSRWTDIQGIPAVSIFENPFYGVDGILKRTFDVAASLALLSVLALPMGLIALLVRMTSSGPAIFKQRRYGLDGKEIYVWKFRSMTVCDNGPVVRQATKGDARVTPLGGFLRKTSLDELPQLINVLGGTMSLVGPRPHATAHNEEYRQVISGYMLRHKVKPGITGLAQVSGWRGETDSVEKMEGRINADHRYIREWSLLLDLKILFRTLFVAFNDSRAY